MKHKSPKLKWMGLWHCYYGLWNGIHPRHHLDDDTARGWSVPPKEESSPVTAPEEPARFIPLFSNPSKMPGSTS